MNVAQSFFALDMEIVKRNKSDKWEVLPQRWIVERTIAWLMGSDDWVMDYERTTESVERCLYISMIMDKNYN
jgi:transposase